VPGGVLTPAGDGDGTYPTFCGEGQPDNEAFDVSQTGTFLTADTATAATMPPVKSDQSAPFTVAACYCPSYEITTGQRCIDQDPNADNCCDIVNEYIQQVGVLYYWTIRLCNYDNYDSCLTPYMRVIPQQKFVVRVECPPGGGCNGAETNRISLIDVGVNNDRPSWDLSNGCKTTTAEPTSVVWPAVSDSRSLHGGSRVDYKVWRTKQVKLNLSVKKSMDLCYCNSNCQVAANWFKIGQVMTASNFAFASQSAYTGSPIKTIEYVDHAGSVTLLGGMVTGSDRTEADPYDGNQYSGKALVNIISYDRETVKGIGVNRASVETHFGFHRSIPADFQTTMDAECQRAQYSATLVTGPQHQQAAATYIAKVRSAATDNSIDPYFSFSGENQDQTIKINLAGVVAVCYCAMVDQQNECEDSDWIFTGRLTIMGPTGGQQWRFPTHVVVGLSVVGWGLNGDDRLRIIPAGSTCQDNSNDPAGDTNFRVGCPSQDGGCRSAGVAENIVVTALTAIGSSVMIQSVTTQADFSELTFSDDITDKLLPDDMITLDIGRVMVEGKLSAAMNPSQLHETYKLSGEYQFQDSPADGQERRQYIIGHRVNHVTVGGEVVKNKLSIPVGWASNEAPSFTFDNGQGHWVRRNKVDTNVELKGKQPMSNLKLCWGRSDGSGSATYYSQAGEVTFEDPPVMASAKVSLTTKQQDSVSPVVISIETGAQRDDYATNTGKTKLMLRFMDISDSNGKLIPRWAGDITPTSNPPSMGANEETLPTSMAQYLCGRLFNEMWSAHEEGFPVPEGCYYGRKYKDLSENSVDEKFYREITLVFGARNGLRQNTQYQLVMNAEAKVIATNEVLLNIYAMCYDEEGCSRPFNVFEMGPATSSYETMPMSGLNDPAWGDNGLALQLGDPQTNVLSLSGLPESVNRLQMKLRGLTGSRAIKKENIIRVYLWPLTQWSIGSAPCNAVCEKYHASNQLCAANQVGCDPEEVVAGSNRKNIIKITLPTEMDDITGTTTHTIIVSGLTLPKAGMFPTRVGAQLTKSDDTAPLFTTSTGMVWKTPDPGETTGRLVLSDRTGYGPRPFAAETLTNTLYIRLQMGATVANSVAQVNSAQVTITLPQGYTCKVPDGGVPPADLPVFTHDYPTDGYPDNNRGVLSVASTDGDWSNSVENKCVFDLRDYNTIYAQQVVFVKLTVTNPTEAMSKRYVKNVWQIKISSRGMNSQSTGLYNMPEVSFITLNDEQTVNDEGQFWAGNAAVISPLVEEIIQPADFTRSCCGATFDQRMTQEYLRIFFKTTQVVGQAGFVIIDAPDGFNFDQTCSPRDLDDRYYAFAGETEPQLQRLSNMDTCVGLRYPLTASTYNRAKIQVMGMITSGMYYGVELRVTHPSDYSTAHHSGWYIWTQDFMGYGLEGSKLTVKFNPLQASSQSEFYHKSWGMYRDPLASTQINIASMRPKNISTVNERVTVYPIEFPIATDTSIRITAPVGFVWDTDFGNSAVFNRRSNLSENDFPIPTVDNGVPNQLIWNAFTFKGGTKYGFVAMVSIPNQNPRTSSNSFFIEFGFKEEEIQQRLSASVLAAPPVAALINTQVAFASNLVAYSDNRMEFRFQSVSTLIENDGVVIKGDQNTRGFIFEAACEPKMLDDSPPLPPGILCAYVRATDSTPQITLKVLQAASLPPGFYKFELKVSNPNTRIITAGKWTFGSYAQVDTYPSAAKRDAELVAPGFVVNNAMQDARLLDLTPAQAAATNRNDKPGQPNQLIFRFKLNGSPAVEQDLVLQGPRGVQFDQDCLPGLKTDANQVFGDNTEGSWPPDYEKWPPAFAPNRCEGIGHKAYIRIPSGLLRRNFYVFRLAVAQNPMETPEWNLWSMMYNGETSAPFQGFTVWTFTGMTQPLPVSYAKSPTGANVVLTENPVMLEFTPYKSIPERPQNSNRGGLMRVTAPAGFSFVKQNQECIVDLFETEQMDATMFTPNVDYVCEVDPTGAKMSIFMTGERRILGLASGNGRAYTMIVRVYNPPGTASAEIWKMDSFSEAAAEMHTALDVSQVMGYPINDVLIIYTVTNTNNVLRGAVAVNDVDITLRFPDPIKDDDVIEVRGPLGYNLVGDADTNACNDFRYPGNNNPFPTTGFPSCVCRMPQLDCVISWRVRENRDPAYPQNEDIRFKIATINPIQTPLLMDNFWKTVHYRGNVVRSSHVARSWNINPQLDPVEIEITGPNQAAETLSDLTFTITPVQNAGTIKLEALFPTEFDFSTATVGVPFDIDPATQGPTIIVNLRTSPLIAGQPFELRINSVQLGRGGGQTRWNLMTYRDETLEVKLDERLQFEGGFRLPGKISVLGEPELQSQYKEFRDMYPVKSLFQPRVNEDATALFRLSFSQNVNAQQTLKITCQGDGAYTLRTSPFVIIGIGQIQVSTVLDQFGALLVTVLPGRPASEVALQKDTPYSITMRVFPKPGTNTWRFDTIDTIGFTNTNDGATQGFTPVERMALTVQTQRSPPMAIIEVTLNIDQGSAVIRELLIIAPPGFTFDERAAGCGDMCMPGRSLEGRRTATIASPTGEPLTKLSGLRIRVQTPEMTPLGMGSEGLTWFVEGRGQGAGTTTGWGEATGFIVTQMTGTRVSYAGIANLQATQISFTFQVDVDAGSSISVIPPPGYLLTCSMEGSLKQISLPGGLPNCIDDPLQLQLLQPLTAGLYAFAITVDLPDQTPGDNTFNIIIRDQDNNVVDAAYRIQGQELHPIAAELPTLGWSRADPGQPSTVTVGMTFNRDTIIVKALLITLPDLFQHDVQIPIDVQNLNKRFPVAAGMDWADTSEPNRIKIFLDDSDDSTNIPPDTYRFSFPVLIPPEVPKDNIWYLSLCNDRSCTQPEDRYTLASFPMAGFRLYELAPEGVRVSTNFAKRRDSLSLGVCILLSLFATLM